MAGRTRAWLDLTPINSKSWGLVHPGVRSDQRVCIEPLSSASPPAVLRVCGKDPAPFWAGDPESTPLWPVHPTSPSLP